MRRAARWLVVLFFLGLIPLVLLAPSGLRVAVGYSAKQLCSGVFVATLPETFVIESDIRLRMAVLGPALWALNLSIDQNQGFAEASLFGVSARAMYRQELGCALFADNNPDANAVVGKLSLRAEPSSTYVHPRLEPAVAEAFREPQGGRRNTLAVLISKNGALLAERYAAPVTAAHPMQGWSMNKSLMATWIGMQAQRGALDPARPLVEMAALAPEFANLDPTLNLLHLLQMESGLGFEEFYGPGSDVTHMLYGEPAMWKVPATSGAQFAPGERFSYSSGDLVLASYLWQQSLDIPYERWIEREFSAPLDIQSLVAEADASGIQVGSSYAYMTGRDWLRVGQLWLDAWQGRSELLSQAWLRESLMPRKSDSQGRYGRGFWLNTGGVAFPGLPESLFQATGSSGQYLIVIPEWEMVILRLGLTGLGADRGMQALLESLAEQQEQLP